MSRLRIFFSSLFFIFVILQSQAISFDLSDFDEEAIKKTVESQLQAFAEDDFDKAFKYAAPSIKKIFSSPDNFKLMVINQYPAVYRPKKVTFGDIITYRNSPGCILSMSDYERI